MEARQKFAESKIKIRGISSRLSECIPEQAVSKGLWWSLYFENRKDVFIYRCIKNSCFTFSKAFFKLSKGSKKGMNILVKSINRALCNLQI